MSTSYDEVKARNDAEIDRVCAIGVAEENRKLQEGAPGPGDPVHARAFDSIIEESNPTTIQHVNAAAAVATERAIEEQRDEYREAIEAEPEQGPGDGSQKSAVIQIKPLGRLAHFYRQRVEEIRALALQNAYHSTAQSDIALLLEIVDAFDQGRL